MNQTGFKKNPTVWSEAIAQPLRRIFAVALIPVSLALIVVVEPAILSSPRTAFVRPGLDEPHSINRRLRSEEAFLIARQKQAKREEVALAVDLQDSTVVLSILGVPLRSSTSTRLDRSAILDRMSYGTEFLRSAQSPFGIAGARSSIPRVPVRIVEAPKDTSEARLRPPEAFAPDERFVWAEFRLEGGLVLQLEPLDEGGSWLQQATHAASRHSREAVESLSRFFRQDESLPPLWIRVELPSSDIRAIYRALPEAGTVAIRF